MARMLALAYGVVAYLLFFGSFVYTIAFIGDVGVPKSVDTGPAAPPGMAVLIDLCLLALFGLQHSVMARQGFKRMWTRYVPHVVERSTYVLAASLALAFLCWQWRPVNLPVVWDVQNAAAVAVLHLVFWLGWAILFAASFAIDHFELFGLRQVMVHATRQTLPRPEFRTPLLYRYVRHPIYLGFVLGAWATPVMTASHLLFAVGSTLYILVGIAFEERDLIAQFGEQYRRYRAEVNMLLPGRREGRS